MILQCADNNADDHTTANVLKLAGDLKDRTIQLGNLNITSENSIALAQGAKADLSVNYDGKASKITAKNILAAGSGTELKIHTGLTSENVEDITKKAQIKLDPLTTNRAAIGGSSENPGIGKIEVDNLDLNLGLPAGSSASGIGAGAKTGTADGTRRRSVRMERRIRHLQCSWKCSEQHGERRIYNYKADGRRS